MELTVSRKTDKNLAVGRKNERILTVSRKKILTVKKYNHKIRFRDLLLSPMCYAFMCSGGENYKRNRQCRKCVHNLSHVPQHNTMPPEPLLLTSLPDVVHIGISLKCSWSDWFIDLDGQMSNLVLIRTLRDSTDSDVRKLLRRMLTLECVRNIDRMAVEPIVRFTRPEVIEVLIKVSLVLHTLFPEKGPLINKGFVARDLLAVFCPLITT